MSSLRPEGSNGRSGRSRSRNRSRDARVPSPESKKVSSRHKEKDSDREKRRSRHEVDEEEKDYRRHTKDADSDRDRSSRKPLSITAGLAALTAGLNPLLRDEGESEKEDSDQRRRRRRSHRSADVSDSEKQPSRSMTMPVMPSFPAMSDHEAWSSNEPLVATRKSKKAPLTAYPMDDSPMIAMMPSADYDLLGQVSYSPDPESQSPNGIAGKGKRGSYFLPPDEPHNAEIRTPHRSQSYSTPLHASESPDEKKASRQSRLEDDHRGWSPTSMPTASFGASPPSSNPYSAELREFRPKKRHDEDDDDANDHRGRFNPPVNMLSTGEPKHSIRAPSPGGLNTRMASLSVSGHRPDLSGGSGLPPPSPLLEAYKGTYQTIGMMPSPMMMPVGGGLLGLDDDIEPMTPLEGVRDRDDEKPKKRRARIYDPESDAKMIYDALNHRRHADSEPLIEVLPARDHDQIEALRNTYRKTYKYSGAKIDMVKHIKMMTEGNFGKICFVTASGRWKSEAYWANCWYQSHSSSRELLIESLMGRSNAEIREIKHAFRDKKYDDDLERCLRKELKPDKFRDAVLLVLAEQRQEETDSWPAEYVTRDINALRMALVAPQGGESTILKIVCTRSEKHLGEVLRSYESTFGSRFASDALRKSGNLVGEVIAHILNGIINRPSRDALLLQHALADLTDRKSRTGDVTLRHELLISRLVRLHWDQKHLALVKAEYRRKFGARLENQVDEATRGDYGEFCIRLCEI